MFIKAKRSNGEDKYCYINTDYITEIFPPNDNVCGMAFLIDRNYGFDIDKEEFEKFLRIDLMAENDKTKTED